MDTTYNPQDIEQSWYKTWEQKGYFKPSGKGEPYCIMIPPPNVTGSLHMGHAFQHTIMDTLIRYQRMQGKNVLWQPGTDHAGISTQMVVERQLLAEGKNRHDLGREKFVEKIWDWKQESGNKISQQLRRMGSSVDWSREKFTMDEDLSKAVSHVFIKLYEEGLIYRGNRLVNWDPTLVTAISDLEVNNVEKNGHMWHIRYPIADSDEHLVVATTRPETMLGDTAVAVHPEDERYANLIGKFIALPLTNRKIPIIADDYVDKDFGTGCVKITPAHDFNDYDMGKRHNLPLINILTKEAKINDNAPEAYQGLDRFAARKQIVADLDAAGLLEKVEDHKLQVPYGDRSGSVIEPYLTDQWFVAMESLAKPAIDAVKNNKMKFVPESSSKIYFQWLENIQDWCISRQLWWGHRIPAWYDEQGHVYVASTETEAREKYKLDASITLTQDPDVLETWFSSALWPFSTLGWPDKTEELKTFYPTSVLVTGFDIIFFWVARMMMMGLKFTDNVPFHEVFIHGLIRDSQGQKMSKSKGNGIDPLDLIDGVTLEELLHKRTDHLMQPEMAKKIEKATRKEFPEGINAFGTDALRFTYCALASTGRDIRFDMGRIEGYRNFCNKLWNAARYVFMNTGEEAISVSDDKMTLSLADKWIRSELQNTITEYRKQLDNYRFDLASQVIYEFVWNEFCDWYLELSKPVLTNENATAEERHGTLHTLVHTLETILRLLHPITPYITEEIWQKVAKVADIDGETIMLQPFPEADQALVDQNACDDIRWLKQLINGVRNIRGEMNISPKKAIPVLLHQGSKTEKQRVLDNADFLKTLAKLESITFLKAEDEKPAAATALAGDMEILIPLKGLIDKDAEAKRLNKQIEKAEKEKISAEKKLANENYLAKAPADVVAAEKAKVEDLSQTITTLLKQLEQLKNL